MFAPSLVLGYLFFNISGFPGYVAHIVSYSFVIAIWALWALTLIVIWRFLKQANKAQKWLSDRWTKMQAAMRKWPKFCPSGEEQP